MKQACIGACSIKCPTPFTKNAPLSFSKRSRNEMSRNYPSQEKYVCMYLDWSIPTSIKSQRPLKRATTGCEPPNSPQEVKEQAEGVKTLTEVLMFYRRGGRVVNKNCRAATYLLCLTCLTDELARGSWSFANSNTKIQQKRIEIKTMHRREESFLRNAIDS